MRKNGFIDLHTHGLGRYDTRTERAEDILRLARLHGGAGTAAILPTVYPAPLDKMRRSMVAVREAIREQKKTGGNTALILGLHLEGPFLNPVKCGALDKGAFLRPSIASLKRLIEGFEDIVKIMTVAPELPGALKVIEKCAESGIKVNMGHSDATSREALSGKLAGAAGVTHLFNCMRPIHHREPGLSGLGLVDRDLYVEVIADGKHIGLEVLKLIFSVKRRDRIILVSDSVKGPMYKKGILQGSKKSISEAAAFLSEAGIPETDIIKAALENPKRFLKGK